MLAGDVIEALHGRPSSLPSRLLVAALAPCAWLYAAGLELYLLPYRAGWRRRHRLPCPVVSIGNLASGGTGKTGLVLTLVRALRAEGVDVCILSRGYRGAREGSVAVAADRDRVLLDAEQAGDEAFMLAAALPGTPVVVGRDRRRTGQIAVQMFRPDIIVLDDGMQYYQLHRDREITLLDAERPFGNGWTLPAGILREPPGHLRRSDWVVLSGADPEQGVPDAPTLDRIRMLSGHARVLLGDYRGAGLRSLDAGERWSVNALAGRRVATLCALGNPGRFERQVARSGAQVVRRIRYPDHHVPSEEQLRAALTECARTGAEMAVVSEKDAVKLVKLLKGGRTATAHGSSSPCSVRVYEAAFELNDMNELMDDLLGLVRRERSCKP